MLVRVINTKTHSDEENWNKAAKYKIIAEHVHTNQNKQYAYLCDKQIINLLCTAHVSNCDKSNRAKISASNIFVVVHAKL